MTLDVMCILQVIITLSLIFIVLLQKTGNDTISGLSSSGLNVFSNKTSGNLLKKTTVILAIAFMINSLLLARRAMRDSDVVDVIISDIEKGTGKNSSSHTGPIVPNIE